MTRFMTGIFNSPALKQEFLQGGDLHFHQKLDLGPIGKCTSDLGMNELDIGSLAISPAGAGGDGAHLNINQPKSRFAAGGEFDFDPKCPLPFGCPKVPPWIPVKNKASQKLEGDMKFSCSLGVDMGSHKISFAVTSATSDLHVSSCSLSGVPSSVTNAVCKALGPASMAFFNPAIGLILKGIGGLVSGFIADAVSNFETVSVPIQIPLPGGQNITSIELDFSFSSQPQWSGSYLIMPVIGSFTSGGLPKLPAGPTDLETIPSAALRELDFGIAISHRRVELFFAQLYAADVFSFESDGVFTTASLAYIFPGLEKQYGSKPMNVDAKVTSAPTVNFTAGQQDKVVVRTTFDFLIGFSVAANATTSAPAFGVSCKITLTGSGTVKGENITIAFEQYSCPLAQNYTTPAAGTISKLELGSLNIASQVLFRTAIIPAFNNLMPVIPWGGFTACIPEVFKIALATPVLSTVGNSLLIAGDAEYSSPTC